jgi:hypothetical protein
MEANQAVSTISSLDPNLGPINHGSDPILTCIVIAIIESQTCGNRGI